MGSCTDRLSVSPIGTAVSTAEDQAFIDAAEARGEDTFAYLDEKSGEQLLVSGSSESIRLLADIIADYEFVSEVLEDIGSEISRVSEVS